MVARRLYRTADLDALDKVHSCLLLRRQATMSSNSLILLSTHSHQPCSGEKERVLVGGGYPRGSYPSCLIVGYSTELVDGANRQWTRAARDKRRPWFVLGNGLEKA